MYGGVVYAVAPPVGTSPVSFGGSGGGRCGDAAMGTAVGNVVGNVEDGAGVGAAGAGKTVPLDGAGEGAGVLGKAGSGVAGEDGAGASVAGGGAGQFDTHTLVGCPTAHTAMPNADMSSAYACC